MARKKLLFVTTRLFWPTDEGHKVLLYNYCKGLCEIYNYDIYLYSFLEEGQDPEKGDKPDFIKKIFIARHLSTSRKIGSVLQHSFFSAEHWSFQSSMFFSQYNSDNIQKLVKKIRPDAIFIDMIRLSPYFSAIKNFKGIKVLFMEDALSKRYIRQIQAASTESGIAGRFGSNLPCFVNKFINSKVFKKRILISESKRLEKEEVRAARRYDAVIYVNEIEANEMNRKAGRKNSFTVTQGADCDYYSALIEVEKVPNTLAYVGNMGVAANADAVRMIMGKIMPLISSRPIIHFIGYAPEILRTEYKDNPQCIFEGRVDDIRLSVRATEVVLSPIAYGTGVKTKVIEGMAMSMPVVTNYLGIDGLSVEVGRDLLVSDDFNEIAAMVEDLLSNPKKKEDLGKHGYNYVMAHHQWKDIYKVFGQMGL